MSINEVRWLSECGSTNAYAKEHFEEFGPVGAVYTTNQTAGRGRLGRSWVNAEGRALYYTAVIREPLAQPATLPLLASLAVRDQLAQRYGVDCQIKWPNDLLLNGKKIVGILCESVSYGYQMQGRGIVCGIGINLAQPQSYFDTANLPNGTSLELQGAKVDLAADPQWLAEALTDFGFDRPLYTFAREGFAPFRDEYKASDMECNMKRRSFQTSFSTLLFSFRLRRRTSFLSRSSSASSVSVKRNVFTAKYFSSSVFRIRIFPFTNPCSSHTETL